MAMGHPCFYEKIQPLDGATVVAMAVDIMSASRRSERLRVKRSRLAATDNDVDSAQQLEATRESVAKHEKQKKRKSDVG